MNSAALAMLLISGTSKLRAFEFEPLDDLDERMGGERHGLWDHTWVRSNGDAPAFVTLYSSTPVGDLQRFEVWASGPQPASDSMSLVRRFEFQGMPSPSLSDEILTSLGEAARRSIIMARAKTGREQSEDVDLVAADVGFEAARAYAETHLPDRMPQREAVEIVRALLHEWPTRTWANREVLAALLESGFAVDRAAVNAALAELAWRGEIKRLKRGYYSAEPDSSTHRTD